MSGKTLTLIAAAAAKNNGIGANYALPWHLPKDMKYFNRVTTTTSNENPAVMNACIMGRKTWESFPGPFRPLPNRYNIVITSNPDLIPTADSRYAVTAPSFTAALAHIDSLNNNKNVELTIDRVFVVGGGCVYQEAMVTPGHHVQILLTRVEFPDADICDAFFPPIDTTRFVLQPHQRLVQVATFDVPSGVQTESGLAYEFLLFEEKE
ncbi:dihydrofolate reductase [Coemansia sp. BCRC 34301]|nr:dihydrofolate reductase [Coemansia sp. BCRC 34301]